VQRLGLVFIKQGMKLIKSTLDIDSYYTILDRLSLRLTSISSKSVFHFLPKLQFATTKNTTLFILENPLSIIDGKAVCAEADLQLASLSSLVPSYDFTLPPSCPSLLLSDSVYFSKNKITGLMQPIACQDSMCWGQWNLMSKQINRSFFHNYTTFYEEISNKFPNIDLLLAVNQDRVFLTKASIGCFACIGTPDTPTDADILAHNISLTYQTQLTSSLSQFISVLTHLVDQSQQLLDDLVASSYTYIAHTSSPLPRLVLVTAIKQMTPTFLPTKIVFSLYPSLPNFDQLFTDTLTDTDDTYFYNALLNLDYDALSDLDLNKLYTMLLTFQQTLLRRLTDIKLTLNPDSSVKLSLPHRVLLSRSTPVSAFKNEVAGTFGLLPEDNLHLIFKIMMTAKYHLFLELSSLLNLDMDPAYAYVTHPLTRPPKLLSPVTSPPYLAPTPPWKSTSSLSSTIQSLVQDYLNDQQGSNTDQYLALLSDAIHTYKSSLPSPTPTPAPSTHTGSYTASSAASPSTSPAPSSPPVSILPNLHLFGHPRTRRNIISSVLSTLTGLATNDDLNKVLIFDQNILDKESYLEYSFRNLSLDTSSMLKTVQNVTNDLSSLIAANAALTAEFDQLFKVQIQADKNMDVFLTSLKSTASLSNTYNKLLSELLVATFGVTKLTTIVHNILHNQLDPLYLDSQALRRFLGQSYLFSLKHSKLAVTFNGEQYDIIHQLPVLSEPFTLYKLMSLPMVHTTTYTDDLQISPYIILGSNHLTGLTDSSLSGLCVYDTDSYLCPSEAIHFSPLDVCERQLTIASLSPKVSNVSLCYDRFAQTSPAFRQKYLYHPRHNLLVVSSSMPDTLSWSCPTASDNVTINVGLNIITYRAGCTWHSSYLAILHPFVSYSQNIDLSLTELNVSLALRELDKYILSDDKHAVNYTAAIQILSAVNHSVSTGSRLIHQVIQSANQIQESNLHTFNPFHFNLTAPVLHQSHLLQILFWTGLLVLACFFFGFTLQIKPIRLFFLSCCSFPCSACSICFRRLSTFIPSRRAPTSPIYEFSTLQRRHLASPSGLIPADVDHLTPDDEVLLSNHRNWLVFTEAHVRPVPILFLLHDGHHYLNYNPETHQLLTTNSRIVKDRVYPPSVIQALISS
jgi:hypothetical protein